MALKTYKCEYTINGEKRVSTVTANSKVEAKSNLAALYNATDITIGEQVTIKDATEEQEDKK